MTAGSLIVFMLPSFIATLLLLVLCRIYNRIGEWPAQHTYVPACHAGIAELSTLSAVPAIWLRSGTPCCPRVLMHAPTAPAPANIAEG